MTNEEISRRRNRMQKESHLITVVLGVPQSARTAATDNVMRI